MRHVLATTGPQIRRSEIYGQPVQQGAGRRHLVDRLGDKRPGNRRPVVGGSAGKSPDRGDQLFNADLFLVMLPPSPAAFRSTAPVPPPAKGTATLECQATSVIESPLTCSSAYVFRVVRNFYFITLGRLAPPHWSSAPIIQLALMNFASSSFV